MTGNGATGGPGLARWLLERFLPADERVGVINELDEAMRLRFPKGGWRAAAWYYGHTASFCLSFALERAREAAVERRAPERGSGARGGRPSLR